MTTQGFSWHDWNQWHFQMVPTALLVATGVLYLIAATRARAWPIGRSVVFCSGLVATFIATQSVMGVFDRVYFSDHMIQHLALIMVAAPLFALGRPMDLAYETGPAYVRRFLDGPFMRVVLHPLFAFALYFTFIPLTHLTSLFDVIISHEAIHDLEHVGFLIVGYLFFRAAFGRERGLTIHPGLRLVYVMAAVPVDTFTGLALAMSSHNPFPAIASIAPAGSSPASVLADIHLGGAIMWIGGDALMLLACVPITVTWVKWETVRTRELDAELDAQGL